MAPRIRAGFPGRPYFSKKSVFDGLRIFSICWYAQSLMLIIISSKAADVFETNESGHGREETRRV
jgi:hypothetical protein